METTKLFNKNLLFLMVIFLSGCFSVAKAQDRYYYYTFDNSLLNTKNGYYLVISDPVKNWNQMTVEQKNDVKTEFRTSGNKQAGFSLMGYDAWNLKGFNYVISSLSQCKESIQQEVSRFEEYYSKNKEKVPVKVIYVNLRRY